MSIALAEPPGTPDALRERASVLADDVDARLRDRSSPQEGFPAIRRGVMAIAASPAWRTHDLTTELLLLVERLRDELEADPADPEWRVREVLQRMHVVLRAMVRRLEHDELDRPEAAARFVATALTDVEVGAVAELLGTSARMVASYRTGAVGQVRKNPARVTLVAQLVAELIGSTTPRGALLWFGAKLPQLGGRTPRELLDEDPVTHRGPLMAVARGGRAQTDVALDDAA